MACLFSLIAVVALVKCRRVIVLEGAEVRVCWQCGVFMRVYVCGIQAGSYTSRKRCGSTKARRLISKYISLNASLASFLTPSFPSIPPSAPHPPSPIDGHQNLLLPHFRCRRLAGHLVLHPFRCPGTLLRPCRSVGLSNPPLGRDTHFGDSPLGWLPLLICHFCPDHYLLGGFTKESLQTRAETRAHDDLSDHHGQSRRL